MAFWIAVGLICFVLLALSMLPETAEEDDEEEIEEEDEEESASYWFDASRLPSTPALRTISVWRRPLSSATPSRPCGTG